MEQKRDAIKTILTEEQKTQLQQVLDAASGAGHGKKGGKRGADESLLQTESVNPNQEKP